MVSRSFPFLSALLFALATLAAQEMPKPQAEHEKLAQSIGTWDAVIESIGMDGKPQTSKGVSVQQIGPGGFWLIDDFTGECMGTKCTGHGALGYDPIKKVCVQSWVFSMSPLLMVWTGNFDKTGKVLTMTGEAPSMDGTMIKMRKVMTWASADSMTIEVFMVMPDGKEQKTMTLACTRRTEKTAENAGAKK
jgi:hypothetical protein